MYVDPTTVQQSIILAPPNISTTDDWDKIVPFHASLNSLILDSVSAAYPLPHLECVRFEQFHY